MDRVAVDGPDFGFFVVVEDGFADKGAGADDCGLWRKVSLRLLQKLNGNSSEAAATAPPWRLVRMMPRSASTTNPEACKKMTKD